MAWRHTCRALRLLVGSSLLLGAGCRERQSDRLLAVSQAQSAADLSTLAQIATSGRGAARVRAIQALAELDRADAYRALGALLGRAPVHTRNDVLASLMSSGDAKQRGKRALLLRLAKDEARSVQLAALSGLGQQRPLDRALWAVLVDRLGAADPDMRRAARLALLEQGSRAVAPLARALPQLAAARAKRARATLAAILGALPLRGANASPRRAERLAALQSAAESGSWTKHRAQISGALAAEDRAIRSAAARTLVALAPPAAGIALLGRAADRQIERYAVLWGRAAALPLQRSAGDGESAASPQLLAALGVVGGPEATGVLRAALDPDDPPRCLAALRAIARRARDLDLARRRLMRSSSTGRDANRRSGGSPLVRADLPLVNRLRRLLGGPPPIAAAAAIALWRLGYRVDTNLVVQGLGHGALASDAIETLGELGGWLGDTAARQRVIAELRREPCRCDEALAVAAQRIAQGGAAKTELPLLIRRARRFGGRFVDGAVTLALARPVDDGALAKLAPSMGASHWRRALGLTVRPRYRTAPADRPPEGMKRSQLVSLARLALAAKRAPIRRLGAIAAERHGLIELAPQLTEGIALDRPDEAVAAVHALAEIQSHTAWERGQAAAKRLAGRLCPKLRPRLKTLFSRTAGRAKAEIALMLARCGDDRGVTWALERSSGGYYHGLSHDAGLLLYLVDRGRLTEDHLEKRTSYSGIVRAADAAALAIAPSASTSRALADAFALPPWWHRLDALAWLRARRDRRRLLEALERAAPALDGRERRGLVTVLAGMVVERDFAKDGQRSGALAALARLGKLSAWSPAQRQRALIVLVDRAGPRRARWVADIRRKLRGARLELRDTPTDQRMLARAGLCVPLARWLREHSLAGIAETSSPASRRTRYNRAAWNLARCRGVSKALARQAAAWATKAAALPGRTPRPAVLDTLAVALYASGHRERAVASELQALRWSAHDRGYAARVRRFADGAEPGYRWLEPPR